MINQNALATKVREIISNHDLQADEMIDEIEAILRTPKRPTLEDMDEEARDLCQWLQCDVTGFQGQLVLATPYDDDGDAGLISACGEMTWSSPNHVTPRPDLPRLEWPGSM